VKELETHLIVGSRLHLLNRSDAERAMRLAAEISRMLFSLRDRLLERETSKPAKPSKMA